MQTVNFWSFSKKANSTAQPSGVPVKVFQCDIVDGSGLLSPTIKLHTNFADPVGLTYAQIPGFNRYYFVRNWRYDKGLWWADLAEDVLATYKTNIGNFSMYVLRSASEMDGRIVDNTYPIKAGTAHSTEQNNLNPFAVAFNSGYFVVGIINNDSSAVGVVSYYVFTNAEFRTFSSFLLGNSSFLGSPPEISDSLLKCLVNPTNYIVSCVWLPITPPMGAVVTSINVGWWTISSISCHRLSGYTRSSGTLTVTVPKHPDALTRGYYLLQEPYSKYYLDFPPFGSISLNANDLVDTTLLDLHYDVDCITGQGRLDIMAGPTGSTGTISVVHAQVGVPVAMAQNAPDVASAIQSFLSGSNFEKVGNIDSRISSAPKKPGIENAPALREAPSTGTGVFQMAANILSAVVQANLPVQVVGGNGGFMSGYYPVRLILTYATLAADNTSEWGRPLCQIRQLNTLSGFILCADADFSLSCTEPERDAIAGFLTSGFYYE